MFEGAQLFNQDIGNWDVSNGMDFVSKATIVNITLHQLANTCCLRSLTFYYYYCLQGNMFKGVTSFNQDIGNWDVSNGVSFVSTIDSNNCQHHIV